MAKPQPDEAAFHVVEFPPNGARGVVHTEALDGVLAGGLPDLGTTSGLEDLGPTTDRYREPVLTDAEWAASQTPSVARQKSRKQPTSEGK